MLEIKNLDVSFKTRNGLFHAVKNISFQLDKGEIIGIVGESGSGKSVTSLAIMRLLDAETSTLSGNIILDGTDLLSLTEAQMQSVRGNRIGMIFQEPMTSLNPVLTCGYQVAEAIILHQKVDRKEAKKRTIALFKEVQLPTPETVFDKYPHQISGGQKQRVMIAMALSCNPEILIADEPTTALDVTVQKSIIELMLRLNADRRMSIIFISHDLGVINEIADSVMVMYHGGIIEQSPVKQLFLHPKQAYTRGLLACRPVPQYKLKRLPVVADFLNDASPDTLQSSGSSIADIRMRYALSPDEVSERKNKLYQKPPLLVVDNLNIWYSINTGLFNRDKQVLKAVNNVSFEVYPGETLGLVGESGCGKTTLGRSILRLIEPTSGILIFDQTDLRSLNTEQMRKVRRNMQIIFQDPYSSLNPKLTVGQSIMEPLQVHQLYTNDRQRKQNVLKLLDQVKLLPQHFNRYPHEFSGGQRQRIVIARALALQPKFIICDESVSALDVSVQAQVLNLLRDLQNDLNLTYIFISHDLSVVKHIADRILVMNKGVIEESGDAEDIYYHPQKEYTQKLIASIPKAP